MIGIARGGNMLVCNNPKCKYSFCMKCMEPVRRLRVQTPSRCMREASRADRCAQWHADSTCEQYKRWKLENSEADRRFATWAAANTKPCPRCDAKIEKDGTRSPPCARQRSPV